MFYEKRQQFIGLKLIVSEETCMSQFYIHIGYSYTVDSWIVRDMVLFDCFV